MSIAEAPVATLTIEQWYELYRDHEGSHCELVRGHAIMTPTEAFRNLTAAKRLVRLLDDALNPAWEAYHNASVQLCPDPIPTVRVPDVLLARGGLDQSRWLSRPNDVALVAEIVSPGSVETDWIAKRDDYAAAGIPNYLVVDVRTPGEPRLWLFEEILPSTTGPEPGALSPPRYADATGDGLSVTIRIPGADPITIVATDLV